MLSELKTFSAVQKQCTFLVQKQFEPKAKNLVWTLVQMQFWFNPNLGQKYLVLYGLYWKEKIYSLLLRNIPIKLLIISGHFWTKRYFLACTENFSESI